jgi:hypothetical protein
MKMTGKRIDFRAAPNDGSLRGRNRQTWELPKNSYYNKSDSVSTRDAQEIFDELSHLFSDENNAAVCREGEFHDQADAKWIVIRGLVRGHNDAPCGRPNPGHPVISLF